MDASVRYFVSWPVVDRIAVGAAVSEAAGIEFLDVLLELPLELAYYICLVLHFLDLLCNGEFGHIVLSF